MAAIATAHRFGDGAPVLVTMAPVWIKDPECPDCNSAAAPWQGPSAVRDALLITHSECCPWLTANKAR